MKLVPLPLADAAVLLAPLADNPRTDTSGGICGIGDWLAGSSAYMVVGDDGRELAVFAFQHVQRERGRALEVLAARQLAPGGNLTADVLPYIERLFGLGCDVVTIYTRRAGLVRKLEAAGYAPAATIMQKKLGE
jgi:hypothetical protein